MWGRNIGIVVLIRTSATAHRIHTELYHNWYICFICETEIFITVTEASKTPFFVKWSATTYLPHCTVTSQWLRSSFFQYLHFGAKLCSHPLECLLCTQCKNGAMSFSWKCVILTQFSSLTGCINVRIMKDGFTFRRTFIQPQQKWCILR
jgi:hypothetical protein